MRVAPMTRRRIKVYADRASLDSAAARLVERSARKAIAHRGVFRLGLAGGSTPRGLYAKLASEPCRSRIDWTRVEIFWGDERCVPPDHADSNFRMANELLISRLDIPKESVHRIRGELGPERAAKRYAEELIAATGEDVPRFDLVLLGMGDDGHMASLFPDTPDLTAERRMVIPTVSPKSPNERVSLSLRTINAARAVVFLVAGESKAEKLAEVWKAPEPRSDLPASLVAPERGRLLWLVESEAAP